MSNKQRKTERAYLVWIAKPSLLSEEQVHDLIQTHVVRCGVKELVGGPDEPVGTFVVVPEEQSGRWGLNQSRDTNDGVELDLDRKIKRGSGGVLLLLDNHCIISGHITGEMVDDCPWPGREWFQIVVPDLEEVGDCRSE